MQSEVENNLADELLESPDNFLFKDDTYSSDSLLDTAEAIPLSKSLSLSLIIMYNFSIEAINSLLSLLVKHGIDVPPTFYLLK